MSSPRPSATGQFLANQILLEESAVGHYEDFAQRALEAGDVELEAFFSALAEATRMEVRDACAQATGEVRPALLPKFTGGPAAPTRSAMLLRGRVLDLHLAMLHALDLKRRSHAYYASVAAIAQDESLRRRARALQVESALHLAALERWIVRLGA